MAAPAPNFDDRDLVQACLAGDERAWSEIVDRFGRLVYSIPRRYGFSEAEADDVVQDVFLALFRHLDQLQDSARLSSWLITTTHRASWKVGRRRGPQTALESDFADLGQPAPDRAEAWEQEHLVDVALRRLGGPCERLLRALFGSGDEPYASIAERLGISVGSIGPTRARCFRKLEPILMEIGLDSPSET